MTASTTVAPAAARSGRVDRLTRGVFKANLVAQVAIVVTGGIVRLTGSGLGCPTWPECVEGSYVPTSRQEEQWHKYVEFGNRLLTFALGVLAIAAIAFAIRDAVRRRRRGEQVRRPLLVLAAVPLLGTVAQAILGGITVLTGLHPATVAAHFLLSMAIIAGCLVLVVRSGEDSDRPVTWLVPPPVRALAAALVVVTVAVLVVGTVVTGSGPHAGDADVEARFSFDPRTVAWLHADLVLLFLGLTVGMLIALSVLSGDLAQARRRAWLVVGASLIQGAIGYLQYFTGLPWVAVALHMLGACLVWLSVLFLVAGLRTRELEAAS